MREIKHLKFDHIRVDDDQLRTPDCKKFNSRAEFSAVLQDITRNGEESKATDKKLVKALHQQMIDLGKFVEERDKEDIEHRKHLFHVPTIQLGQTELVIRISKVWIEHWEPFYVTPELRP